MYLCDTSTGGGMTDVVMLVQTVKAVDAEFVVGQ